VQTAQILGKHLGMQATPESAIRDWNTGIYAGQKVEDVLKIIQGFIMSPEDVVPGGESFNTYLRRFEPAMRKRVASPGIHLVVGHARGASVLQGIASPVGGVGRGIDPQLLLEKPDVKPGGVMIITPEWKTKVING
jgi:broad specificity phosphatase PhoE